MLVDNVLNEIGAEVINGSVDVEPATALDLADEEGTKIVVISAHCGQVLDYSKQILELAKERNKEYHIFMGGMLNAMLPNNTEPVDVQDKLVEMGIKASNDLEYLVKSIQMSN